MLPDETDLREKDRRNQELKEDDRETVLGLLCPGFPTRRDKDVL
jgi:hypothetical protein